MDGLDLPALIAGANIAGISVAVVRHGAAGSRPMGSAFVVLSTGATELALGPALATAVLPGPRPCLDWFGV
jgi:hypothetical protein